MEESPLSLAVDVMRIGSISGKELGWMGDSVKVEVDSGDISIWLRRLPWPSTSPPNRTIL